MVDAGGVQTALRLTSDMSPQNPNEVLCKAAKMKDGGTSTTAAGAGDVNVVVEALAKGEPQTDLSFFSCSPMFDTFGADDDPTKGEKDNCLCRAL